MCYSQWTGVAVVSLQKVWFDVVLKSLGQTGTGFDVDTDVKKRVKRV